MASDITEEELNKMDFNGHHDHDHDSFEEYWTNENNQAVYLVHQFKTIQQAMYYSNYIGE